MKIQDIISTESGRLFYTLGLETILSTFAPANRNKLAMGGWRFGVGGPGLPPNQWWVSVISEIAKGGVSEEKLYTLPDWLGDILTVIKDKPHRAVSMHDPWGLHIEIGLPIVANQYEKPSREFTPYLHLNPIVGGWRLGCGAEALKDGAGKAPRVISPGTWWIGILADHQPGLKETIRPIPEWASIFVEEMVEQELNWFNGCRKEAEDDEPPKNPNVGLDQPREFADIDWDATEWKTGILRRQVCDEWVFEVVVEPLGKHRRIETFTVPSALAHAINGVSVAARSEGWDDGDTHGQIEAYEKVIRQLIKKVAAR